MVIDMNDAKRKTLAQLKAFLDGSAAVDFRPAGDDLERYAHITAVLRRFGYGGLGRADKGLVRRYLMHTTGCSRAQLARLVKRAANGATSGRRNSSCECIGVTQAGVDSRRVRKTAP